MSVEHVRHGHRRDARGPSPATRRSHEWPARLRMSATGPVTTEYWKSAPYFVNFCDGYQLGDERMRREARHGRDSRRC